MRFALSNNERIEPSKGAKGFCPCCGSELRLVFDAMMNYGLYEKQSKLPDKLQSLFELIKPQIDANIKRRINSKKGGRKPNKE